MSSLSSTTFWWLIDRWHVPDDQGLELVAYDGKLPTTGRRPRFKLSPEQERIVSNLLESDSVLSTAGMDVAWLQREDSTTGRTPLDLLRAGAIDEVLHSVDASIAAGLTSGVNPMISRTTFYSSSNGDHWLILHDGETGRYVVRHEPNMASGGKATDVDAPEFLSRNNATPQGIALQKLLAGEGAIDPDLDT